MGKVEQNKKLKRSNLMLSAYELFTTVGFENTTIRDIVGRAGVAKGTFYLYFNDKYTLRDHLVRHIASKLFVNAWTNLDESLSQQPEQMSVPDKFVYIIDYLIDRVAENKQLLKLINKSLAWGLFTHAYAEPAPGKPADSDSIDFVSYINSRLEADNVRIRDLRFFMFTLINLINSTVYDVLVFEDPVTLEEYKPYLNRCIRLLVNDAIEE